MHELSLAMEVIELVQREADKSGVSTIQEILIEVGDLSGVDADIFKSALEMVVKDTILEGALMKITRIQGKGKCNTCQREFIMKNRIDGCPGCQGFPSEIKGGEEFRVISILAE